MDRIWLLLAGVTAASVAAVVLSWRPMRRFGQQVHLARARESFRLQRPGLETKFLEAAQATGKPRGLKWQECKFDPSVDFVRDRQTGDIVALVATSISFEAIPGGDMEDNPNVGLLRNASAVFYFHKGHWNTVGKAVFNMNPDEAIEHFKNQYEPLK
jgi:hypothetical protein